MDFTFRLLEPQVREILPVLVVLLVTLFLCVLTWCITTWVVNARWRERIHAHLPELWREQLDQEKARSVDAERRAQEAEEERDQMSVAIRGARNLLDMPRLELRAHYRARAR